MNRQRGSEGFDKRLALKFRETGISLPREREKLHEVVVRITTFMSVSELLSSM